MAAMSTRTSFWRRTVFFIVIAGSALFVLMTFAAMLVFPGGTFSDRTTSGYSFFSNFFSELGFTVVSNNQPNPVGAVLFWAALTMAGLSLALFFLAYPQFFVKSRSGRWLSWLGSAFGVAAGICFVGVAFTPANLLRSAHYQFVLWAFGTFPVAVIFYTVAMFRQRSIPRGNAFVFVGFAVLLVLYLLLLTLGPDFDAPAGLVIQATGQKIIVYASIISILIQSVGALRMTRQAQTRSAS
jgi:hypothetical protein